MALPPETRSSLIAQLCNRQDHKAWSEFVELYQAFIFKIVLRHRLSHEDAVEITQNVLLRVADCINAFSHKAEGSSFRGWLYRVSRNLTFDFLRNRKTVAMSRDFDLDLDQIAAPSQDDSDEFLREYKRHLFAWAVEKIRPTFKPQNWQAFWSTTVDNQPVDVVARKLRMDKGQVYVARSRVMARIRKLVRERFVQP